MSQPSEPQCDVGGRAGFAHVEITPPLGVPMGGRGPRFADGDHILDPLLAQCTLLEDGEGSRVALISLDLIGLTGNLAARLTRRICGILGLLPPQVLLLCSHTHSGPMTVFEKYSTRRVKPPLLSAYEDQLVDQVSRLVAMAEADLAPATIHEMRGESDFGVNRRLRGADGETRMGPNADGHFNRDLWVLDIERGKEEGWTVMSYGAHPILVYGYAWTGISADFPGETRKRFAEVTGGRRLQFIQACAANIRPRVLADFAKGEFLERKPEHLQEAGEWLCRDLQRIRERGRTAPTLKLSIHADTGHFLAPRDTAQPFGPDACEALAAKGSPSDEAAHYWRAQLEAGLPLNRATAWGGGLLQLAGNRVIAWIEGEVFSEWQEMLRGWIGQPELILWGYTGEGHGYLPPESLLAEGGYEIVDAPPYSQAGPYPLAPGVDRELRKLFEKLSRRMPT